MKKYEIMFKNGKIEVVDFDTMEDFGEWLKDHSYFLPK